MYSLSVLTMFTDKSWNGAQKPQWFYLKVQDGSRQESDLYKKG
jgi:hypothetical protein